MQKIDIKEKRSTLKDRGGIKVNTYMSNKNTEIDEIHIFS